MISVLVVDDQLVQREGIVRVVEATETMRVIQAVGDLEDALHVTQSQPIELALIDLVLHKHQGTEVGRALRRLQPELKVIIYTHEKSLVLASEIFREQKESAQPGLQGYLLTRNISSSEYLEHIYHQILEHGYFIDPDVLRWHYRFKILEALTHREEECARMIVGGFSNIQIAERMGVSRRRVENLINSLYQKFHILGNPGDPARRVVLAESIRLLTSHHPPAKIISVMIVEDQAEQLDRLRSDLDGDNRIKVIAGAKDGQAGLKIALQTKPDIALIDIHLPDLDGFQLTRQIMEELNHTRIILTSVEASQFLEERSFQSGAIALLPKKWISADRILKLYYSVDE